MTNGQFSNIWVMNRFLFFFFFGGPNFLPFLTYGQGPNKSFQGPKMGPEPHFAHLCANATNVLW